MAIEKVMSYKGYTANYFKITGYSVNCMKGETNIDLALFKDSTSANIIDNALIQQSITLNTANITGLTQLYTEVSKLPLFVGAKSV